MRLVRCLGCGARSLVREGEGPRHCSRCGKPLGGWRPARDGGPGSRRPAADAARAPSPRLRIAAAGRAARAYPWRGTTTTGLGALRITAADTPPSSVRRSGP